MHNMLQGTDRNKMRDISFELILIVVMLFLQISALNNIKTELRELKELYGARTATSISKPERQK